MSEVTRHLSAIEQGKIMNNLSKVESSFVAALEKGSPEARAAFLDEACGPEVEVRQGVERLLHAHDKAGNFLRQSVPPATIDEPPLAERPGKVIGPYKLMEQIGEGGMGLVFVAEQQHPVRRKVALKIIKPGMDSRDVIARFEAERQALALMDHPNIARVFDAGTTESGRPYFVMELVKGIPIVEFCDHSQQTARERLELFVSVCQAVQHAHAKGVIHRDLKPSNVLVAPHDGIPVVKIIDFGVAKAIGQQLTDKTIYTRFSQMIGTPLYMSPEQAEINALDIDIRSDVYSLGVLLYELLTGTTPFDRQRFATAAYDEIRRIIREEEPPKPSTRLSTLGATLSAVSAQRKKLSALVKGDLDWIVMKALEKDRTRRYETASAFAADVRRFLAEQPIEARPPSAWYRFRKLARRNKVALVTAALLGAALVLGTAVSLWQAVRATQAERMALVRREQAMAAEQEAMAKRREAEHARQKLRQSLYASNMRLAQSAWRANDLPLVLDLLKQERPGPGEADLRGFEWHFWNRLCRTQVHSVKLPSGLALAMLSPDGTRMAAVWSRNRGDASPAKELQLRIWDATTGAELPGFTLSSAEPLHSFSRPMFSLDGKRLAFVAIVRKPEGGEEFRLQVLDWDSGRELLALDHLPSYPAPAFDRTGGRLALVNAPRGSKIVDVATGKVLRTISLSDSELGMAGSLALSPDGTRLAALVTAPGHRYRAAAGEVRIWKTDSGKEVLRFKTEPGQVFNDRAFSPDGKYLAIAGRGPLQLRDAASGAVLVELSGEYGDFTYYAFSPDGRWMATASEDGKVRLWDIVIGAEKDGRKGTVLHEEPKRGRAPVRTFTGIGAHVRWVAFSADSRRVSAANLDGTIGTWEIAARPQPIRVGSAGGKLVDTASAGGGRFAAAWNQSEGKTAIKVWDVAGKVLFEVTDVCPGQPMGITGHLRFSADGGRLAYGALNYVFNADQRKPASRLRVWDVASGKELFHQDSDQGLFVDQNFSPDGRRLATSFHVEGNVTDLLTSHLSVWDLAAGKEMLGFDVPGVAQLVFSPDGRRLAGALWSSPLEGGEAELRLWDVATAKEVMPRQHYHGWIGAPVFNRDGTRLAVGAGESGWRSEVRAVDTANGKELYSPLKGHHGAVQQLAFSPDGRRLVSSSWFWGLPGSEIKVWDAIAGRELLTLPTKGMGSFAFSPDGRRLTWVGGPNDGSEAEVRVWDATPLPDEAPAQGRRH